MEIYVEQMEFTIWPIFDLGQSIAFWEFSFPNFHLADISVFITWGLQFGSKRFRILLELYASLITTGSKNARYPCYWSYVYMYVCTCSCVEGELCQLCVLYEGCSFLCTDWEAPELSVFAINWEPEELTTEGSFRVTHTHTRTLLPVCKLCLLQEAIMLACFLTSGGFSQGSAAAMSRSAEQNGKHNRAENFRTLATEPFIDELCLFLLFVKSDIKLWFDNWGTF